MIRPERLTVKAAEALQQAGVLARARGNPVINDAHLFAALLAQDDGIVVPLLQKAGLNVTQLKAETERELDRFPKQSGTAAEPTLSRELSRRSTAPTRKPRRWATPTCRPSISCSRCSRRRGPPRSSCSPPPAWTATTSWRRCRECAARSA